MFALNDTFSDDLNKNNLIIAWKEVNPFNNYYNYYIFIVLGIHF